MTITAGRRASRCALAAALAASLLGLSAARLPARAAAAPPTPCVSIAAQEPQNGHSMPPPALALFAADFPVLDDCEWGYQLGGFGGVHQGTTLHHTPVIFVHGNQADAENWFLVADQMKAEAGYSDQELYALSYNGLENGAAGLPTCCAPAPESLAYWQNTNPPYDEFCCNGGHGASDDPNTLDLYNFIAAVQQYTGSQQVDIVAHSLGVTITRKLLFEHPELRQDVVAGVMIAGANHGTSVCRGIEATYYGCDEISPLEALPPGATTTGSTATSNGWLYTLNSAGEAPGPTQWMSVYNGSDNTDPFFIATPGVFDDTTSPHLDGATDVTCPHTYHNDERVRPDIVHTYLQFLLQNGQAGGALPGTTYTGPAPQFPCTVTPPAATVAEAPLTTALALAGAGAVAGAATLGRRRRRVSAGV